MMSNKEQNSPQQLTLSVKLRQNTSFENFGGAANVKNNHLLTRALESEEPFVYLCGDHGSGKTHLLNACCNALELKGKRVMLLPFKDVGAFDPTLLEGLEQFDAVMIDDVDQWLTEGLTKSTDQEMALFDLYNRLRDAGTMLIVTAEEPVIKLHIGLADLRSRLGAGLLLQLYKLTDEEKTEALISRANDKGLLLSGDVAAYIMKRSDRNLNELFALLDKLDDASLSAQRRLTVPFVKTVLGW